MGDAPSPTGVYPPRSSVWENLKKGPAWERASECMGGVGDANVLKAETGEGAHAPSPSAPPPVGIPPTVQCMGIRPGYGLSPGIAMTIPRLPGGGMSHPNRFGSVSTSMTTDVFIWSAFSTASASSCGRVTRIPVPPAS